MIKISHPGLPAIPLGGVSNYRMAPDISLLVSVFNGSGSSLHELHSCCCVYTLDGACLCTRSIACIAFVLDAKDAPGCFNDILPIFNRSGGEDLWNSNRLRAAIFIEWRFRRHSRRGLHPVEIERGVKLSCVEWVRLRCWMVLRW